MNATVSIQWFGRLIAVATLLTNAMIVTGLIAKWLITTQHYDVVLGVESELISDSDFDGAMTLMAIVVWTSALAIPHLIKGKNNGGHAEPALLDEEQNRPDAGRL